MEGAATAKWVVFAVHLLARRSTLPVLPRSAKASVSHQAAPVALKAAPVDSTEDYDFGTDFTMLPTQIPVAEDSDDDDL